jgi:hypothetical protein
MAKKVHIQVTTEIEGTESANLADTFVATDLSDNAIMSQVQKHIDEWASEHDYSDVKISGITVDTNDEQRKRALMAKLKDLYY